MVRAAYMPAWTTHYHSGSHHACNGHRPGAAFRGCAGSLHATELAYPFNHPDYDAKRRKLQRRQECARKHPYSSLQEADVLVENIRATGDNDINAYHCDWCGQYHIGHWYRAYVNTLEDACRD